MRVHLVVLACLLILSGCSKTEPVAEKVPEVKSDESAKEYELRGEVIRTDPEAKTATIKHDQIGDWMGAMTMEFPVKEAADFAKLAPGKNVRATVHVQGFNYWLTGVEEAPAVNPKTPPLEHQK